MLGSNHGSFDDLVVDLMTYQAFIAGLTHIPEMMAAEGLTFQESLLRVLAETCESELAFVAIETPPEGSLRPFATYPDRLPVPLPPRINSPVIRAAVEHQRCDMVVDTSQPGQEIADGIRCALVIPYMNRGARCVLCICNRNPDLYARPELGIPYVSHEVKMAQALMELRPI